MKKNKEKKIQCTANKAVIDPNQVPDLVVNSLAYKVLEQLKSNKELQQQYEADTGKSIFK